MITDGRILQHRDTKVGPTVWQIVSFPEVNMLKNSSAFAVSVPMIFFIKLGFVSIKSPRETYFLDAPLTIVFLICSGSLLPLRGQWVISAILVKNHFFILLHKFNLQALIYVLWSFRPLSLLCSHLSGHT